MITSFANNTVLVDIMSKLIWACKDVSERVAARLLRKPS